MSSYGDRRRIRLDVEHPCDYVEFGIEIDEDPSTEQVFVYPNPNIEKLDEPAIVGGESYLFTSPPMRKVGLWVFTAAYGLVGTQNIVVLESEQSLRVFEPTNSKVKADADV